MRSAAIRAAHAHFLQGEPLSGVRDVVAASWLRSAAAGIDADAGAPPITLDGSELGDYRAETISFVEGAQWDEEHAGTAPPSRGRRRAAGRGIRSLTP